MRHIRRYEPYKLVAHILTLQLVAVDTGDDSDTLAVLAAHAGQAVLFYGQLLVSRKPDRQQ